jgi:hypothetical protein
VAYVKVRTAEIYLFFSTFASVASGFRHGRFSGSGFGVHGSEFRGSTLSSATVAAYSIY